jgi:PAS domain S-box-containing protein
MLGRVEPLARVATCHLGAAAGALVAGDRVGARIVSAHRLEGSGIDPSVLPPVDRAVLVSSREEGLDPLAMAWVQLFPQAEAWAAVAVRDDHGTPVGALCVLSLERREWTATDVAALEDYAKLAALAIAPPSPHEAKAETRYRLLFERAQEGIWIVRTTGPAVGEVVAANRALTTMHGYPEGELDGLKVQDLVTPEIATHLPSRFQRIAEGGEWIEGESTHVRKDGTTFAAEFSAGPIDEDLAVGFVRDVTAHRNVEAHYRLLFEQARDSICVLQVDRTGGPPRILDANPATAALHGYPIDELRGMAISELSTPASRPVAMQAVRPVGFGADWAAVELTGLRQNGTTFPIEVVAGPLDLARGLLLAIGRDLTDRRRAEAALVAAKDAAEQANRAKSAFLANMSHEIRTPMNAILGYAQVLRRAPELTPPHRQGVEVINRSGEHLLALINDVLDASKIEAGAVRIDRIDVDLEAMLDDMDAMFRERASAKHIGFEIIRYDGLPRYLVADEQKLRQILVNLIGNAIKFTETGGVLVRVLARALDRPALTVEVEDTGPGMAPEELQLLFRPFGQTRAGIHARGGTGLGLVISREYARLMGGDVTVRSRRRSGTSFTLDLPLEEGRRSSIPVRPTRPYRRVMRLADEGMAARVLVFDADPDNRGWIAHLLREVGFDVREAQDEGNALELAESFHPSLVLVDTTHPHVDGAASIGHLRERMRERPAAIIGLRATASEEDTAALVASGADSCLQKPCREDDLFAEARKLLGVEFVYASASNFPERGRLHLDTLKQLCGSQVPPGVRREIREAAHRADYDHLLDLVDDMVQLDAVAVEDLRELVTSYSYDAIQSVMADE